jgi:predicted pyridoxine 5'-phosphate oxidase superfamily flavin-nucleotide-binding protein
MATPYHAGELEVQRRAGLADEARDIGTSISTSLPAATARALAAQRLVVVGAVDDAQRVWATALAAEPGFVGALDERTLRIAAAPAEGDPLAAALRRPAPTRLALLALDPTTRGRIRVNGYGGYVDDALYVRLEQVYVNCRKYISTRRPAGRGETRHVAPRRSATLDGAARHAIAAADTFFIASVADAGLDVSHRGGNPGFVRVADERRLSWPDYRGNAMFNTLGNLALDGRAGLLFVDWESGDTLQLSGRARVDWSPERAAPLAGAQRVVDFMLEELVATAGAVPLRWELLARSGFNP